MSQQRILLGAGAALALALFGHADTKREIARPSPSLEDVKTPAPERVVKTPAPEGATAPIAAEPATTIPAMPIATGIDVFADGALFQTNGPSLWAAHRAWKAEFRGGTTIYTPFFGSSAPRNAPLGMRVVDVIVGGDSIASEAGEIVHTSDRVVIERGAIDEAYVLSARDFEQTFTIDEPVTGDVRVRIAVEGEYVGEAKADGIHFTCDLGSIVYGNAFLVDAKGVKTPIETQFDGQTIELVAPAELLGDATYPVVIDPVLSNYPVTLGVQDTIRPDVAYEGYSSQYLHVFERVYSALDSDIYSWCSTDSGLIAGTYESVDVTDVRWANPSVASNSLGNRFGVVAEVGPVGARSIQMRAYVATTRVYEAVKPVSESAFDVINPVIGGDPNPNGPTYFLVAWERSVDVHDHDIHARLMTADGTPAGSTIFLENSAGTLDTNPAISKSDGYDDSVSQDWTLVWQREFGVDDHDIRAAQVHWNGVVVHTGFTVSSSSLDETNPAVSSILDGASARRYAIVWERRTNPTTRDLVARVLDATNPHGDVLLSTYVSGDLEAPAVDADGSQFLVTFARKGPASDYDIAALSLYSVDGQVGANASLLSIDTSFQDARRPAVTSKHSGGALSDRFTVSYQISSSSSGNDIRAAVVENPHGGPVTILCAGTNATCPCGNGGTGGAGCANSVNSNGGLLTANDGASVSDDELTLIATGLPSNASCLFFQGTSAPGNGNGTIFGDGLRCASGTVVRLGTKSCVGGVAIYPQGADVLVAAKGNVPAAGGVRFYQAWYRNAASFCTVSTFNLTNGVRAIWVP